METFTVKDVKKYDVCRTDDGQWWT